MKFFTAAWATGELPDEEYEAAFPAYAKHLASLSLPPDVQPLADCQLHDAVVEAVEQDSNTLTLSLITGDLQRGYFSTNIAYRGADIVAGSELLESPASDEVIEILYGEIDRAQARFVHRILFSSYLHVVITFGSVVVSTSPRGERGRVRSDLTPN